LKGSGWKNKILGKKETGLYAQKKRGRKKRECHLDFRRLIVRYKRGISKE
jgi:hypothetical protein